MPTFLERLHLKGFLSFGPDASPIDLMPLNVIIGPNGCGKSNLVEAISVLRSVPKDLPLPIREGGGVNDWLWRDADRSVEQAEIEAIVSKGLVRDAGSTRPAMATRYRLSFGSQRDQFIVLDERLEDAEPIGDAPKPYFYFGYERGRPTLNVRAERRVLQREDIDPTQSILSQRRDPESYPEISGLADLLRRVVIYRQWQFGPDAPMRRSCRADVRTDFLSEAFDNLPARLSILKKNPPVKRRLLRLLSKVAPGFDDLETPTSDGQVQLYLTENSASVPARRLSDGTLRFLCLLVVLLDPEPPPLVVVEEPELGLHPDVLPTIRDLLLEAASRCQLIVTTHSTQLVDAMTDHPEFVVVCGKRDGSTELRRLSRAEIAQWQDEGGLGNLWMRGYFGGTRW